MAGIKLLGQNFSLRYLRAKKGKLMVQSIRIQRCVGRSVVWMAALLLAVWGVSEIKAQTTTIYDNPTVLPGSGFQSIEANGNNDAGHIVGTGFMGFGTPLLWMSATAAPTGLPMGGFFSLEASDINNVGQIVGSGFVSEGSARRPLFWANSTAVPVLLSTGGF